MPGADHPAFDKEVQSEDRRERQRMADACREHLMDLHLAGHKKLQSLELRETSVPRRNRLVISLAAKSEEARRVPLAK
jgi:hypothetical protein